MVLLADGFGVVVVCFFVVVILVVVGARVLVVLMVITVGFGVVIPNSWLTIPKSCCKRRVSLSI